jgi:two-component system, sensor histidine kinase
MNKWAGPLFLSAVLYYLLGKFGLTLAIPPGFASAVWPASGGALFCMIYFRHPAVVLGVGLGSFSINLGVSSGDFQHLSWSATVPAFGIALGALSQAYLGYYLYRKLVGLRFLADTPNEILKFIVIVAPLGCLLAPTFGVTTLYLLGIVSPQNYAFNWMTWWAGDSIGVLFFTPLMLTVFSRDRRVSIARKVQIVLPVVLIFIGVLTLFYTSTRARNNEISRDISDNGKRFVNQIEKRLNDAYEKLLAYDAFFQSSNEVSREEFNQFSSVLLKKNTVFQAVGWAEIITGSEREAVEQIMRLQGFADFQFTELNAVGELVPASHREHYFPLLYIYPYVDNRLAMGMDLGANLSRYSTLMKALQLAKPMTTEPIRLVQETDQQLALILYVPVFDPTFDRQKVDPQDINKHFKGFLSGAFRLSGIMGEAPDEIAKLNFSYQFKDVTDKASAVVLAAVEDNVNSQFETYRSQFNFGGRELEIEFYANSHYKQSSKDWTSWSILSGGLLLVAMLQGFILLITGNTALIHREVKRKTRELTRAMAVADKANQAKSAFTATISHEIRTPLNAIIGLVNQCLKTDLNHKQQHYLHQTKLASGTLLSLINLTLDFAKIESGKLDIEDVEFSLSEILQKIFAVFDNQATEKGITFKLKLPPTLPSLLLGDPLRIEQVLLNLCSNGVKFTAQGEVSLRVLVQHLSDDKITVEFIVADTGIGIAQDKQDKLFESFQQADSSMSRKFGGSGLGLVISKQLTELMGGTITMYSEENQGTEFTVKLELGLVPTSQDISSDVLPAAEERLIANAPQQSLANQPDIKSAAIEQQSVAIKALANKAVLLVEDVAINQFIATEMLEEHGAIVSVAANGLQAIEMIKQQSFDIVLMDIQMPEMDGYEASTLIRKDPRFVALPIIAMTANAMQEDINKAIASGMNDHIAKPIDEAIMLAKINKWLRISEV